MFLLCNADVHFSNIFSEALIWFVPPEHSTEAESHFYIRVCWAEGKTAVAWKRLEISHLKALFSHPQPKHFTQRGQRSPTVKTNPKLHSAPARKLSRVETQSSPSGQTPLCRLEQTVKLPPKSSRYIILTPTGFYKLPNLLKTQAFQVSMWRQNLTLSEQGTEGWSKLGTAKAMACKLHSTRWFHKPEA